jgi:hypothetical protein
MRSVRNLFERIVDGISKELFGSLTRRIDGNISRISFKFFEGIYVN